MRGRERWPEAALAALLLLAPLTLLPGGVDPARLPQSLLVQCATGALLAAVVAFRRPLDFRPQAPLLALPFVAWAGLSVAWARNPYEVLPQAAHWTACVLAGWLAGALLDVAGVARIQAAAFGSGAVVALVGLAQALLGLDLLPQAVAPAATFMHKNVAAEHVVLTLPLACGLLATASARARRAVVTIAALMTGFVLLTLTRAAWLALATQAIVLVALGRRRWPEAIRRGRRLALSCAAALALVALLATAFSPQARERAERVSARIGEAAGFWEAEPDPAGPYSSVLHRRAIWLNTLRMVHDAPLLGVGLANHRVLYPVYARSAAVDRVHGAKSQLDYVHDDYLQVLAELGAIGAVLGLVFLVALWRTARSALGPADAATASAPLALGSVISLVGLGVVAAFSFPLESAIPPLLLMVNAGSLSVLAHRSAPIAEASSRARSSLAAAPESFRLGSLAVAVAVTLACGWSAVVLLRADRHALRAAQAEARGDWPLAEGEARAALALEPHRRDALFLVGRARFFAGALEPATSALEAYLELWPNDMNALGDLGIAAARLNQPQKALAHFQRVLRIAPEDALAHHEAAKAWERIPDMEKALEEHRLAIRYGPLDPLYRYRYGVAAMRAGRYGEAHAGLAGALNLDPDSALAHKAFGVLLYEILGDKEQGRAHLRRALELDPRMPDAERMRSLIAG